MRRLFRQFSFPGGIPSHAAPETPGSINEGGELGYALVHAYGAALDNPDLVVACVVGDGEAETGPLAAAWHSNKFLNPVTDGAVLPILHLNGYKIANPTVLARIPDDELVKLFEGYGHRVHVVSGHEPDAVHRPWPTRSTPASTRSPRSSRGLAATGARRPGAPVADDRAAHAQGLDRPVGRRRRAGRGHLPSHQVPLAQLADNPGHLRLLEEWMRSYRPEELFDGRGADRHRSPRSSPDGDRRMGANPLANGGRLRRDLDLRDFRIGEGPRPARPGRTVRADARAGPLGCATSSSATPATFRIMGPDETASNRLSAGVRGDRPGVDGRDRARRRPPRPHGPGDGGAVRAPVPGLARGLPAHRPPRPVQLLRGLHPHRRLDVQPARQVAEGDRVHLDWRAPISSFTYLLSSHVWRQDHNGFSHQDPGFIDHVVNKKAEVVRSTCRPTPTRCCRRWTTACAASTT